MATKTTTGNSPATLEEYVSEMDGRLSHRSKGEYANRLKELGRKIDLGDEPLTPQLLATSLREFVAKNDLSPAAFRMYRAASIYWFGQQAQALMAANADYAPYAQAYEQLKALRVTGQPSVKRTSGKKLKYFSDDCREELGRYVEKRGHRAPNAVRAKAFVEANALVGLRPQEWFNSSFASYFVRDAHGNIQRDSRNRIMFEHMLVVENAKNTHGRGNGPTRELVLYGITPDELKTLAHFHDIASKFKHRHPAGTDEAKLTNLFYRPMNTMIRRALLLGGFASSDIPSCYSTRHQLVADFKATSGVTKREIAAFFGHSSVYTNQKHYGHKKSGRGGTKFRASPESLAMVTDRSLINQLEVITPELATAMDRWASEQEARKAPTT